MDLTKTLAELRRVKDFLGAISLTEETLLQVAEVSDEINTLGKQKASLESDIARLTPELAAARKSHGIAIAGLNAEIGKAKDALSEVRKEIAAQLKAFQAEEKEHATRMSDARKEHNALVSALKKEQDNEQAKLEQIRGTVQKITGLAG